MEKYLPTVLIVALLTRILITGAGLGEALALGALSALYGFLYYLESKKEPKANKDLWDRLISLEEQHKTTKEKVNSITLVSSLKR